jgi:hypothetical protein
MTQTDLNRAVRHARRKRVLGPDARCSRCGCTDLTALTERTRQGKRVILCYECAQIRSRRATVERHHLLGRVNDPSTVGMPGNLHRDLSDKQLDWPEEVRHNTHRNPLLTLAGVFYALHDVLQWLVQRWRKIADNLVKAGRWAESKGGPHWWVEAGLEPL